MAARFLHVAFTDKKGTVYNPLDLTEIGEKTDRAEYICIEEFWLDIKWIVHNTKVHRSGELKNETWTEVVVEKNE